ncbi:MAG: helix-turn-helix transcriptional regulator [Acutalibacteraceae bacterium]|nr:helix-turn-helix transcriptional regulator [Acutalibacteraceae bacterium]
MFINKAFDGSNNICGKNISVFRKELKVSQRQFADLLQLNGLDIDKNAIQRIESGQRFVTDIELVTISKVLNKSYYELLNTEN